MLKINFTNSHFQESNGYVVLIDEKLSISSAVQDFDKLTHGVIIAALVDKEIFSGKYLQTKTLSFNTNGKLKYVTLLGLGDQKKLKENQIEAIGSKIVQNASCFKLKTVEIIVQDDIGDTVDFEVASLIASGASLYNYRFDKYKTKEKPEDKPKLTNITLSLKNSDKAQSRFNEYYQPIVRGVHLARDCISEVPNVLYPESYADIINKEFDDLDVRVTILDEDAMRKFNMNALLGVGQGSSKPSKLVIMEYSNDNSHEKPLGFVGKGVCFDTGGISIKPADGMWDMKYDMAGSAAVVGLIKTLALRKARVNVVGVVGLVENMPDGNAQRPGDIVVSASGQTIEVLNTDAEGRLVLADALWYIQKHYDPKFIIDLATLTGAVRVALGETYCGAFSNNDELVNNVVRAGEKVDEKAWRLPLHPDYDKMINSDFADVANITPKHRGAAGSITAAQFLQRFIDKDRPWVHLDIAGTAWNNQPTGVANKGAVGYGVRLLNRMIFDHYEVK